MATLPNDYQTLLDQVRVRVPGALDPVIVLEVEAVLLDFFDSTNCWQEDLPVVTAANIVNYFLPMPSMGIVKRLLRFVDTVSCLPIRNTSYSHDGSMVSLQYAPNMNGNALATVALIPDIRVPLSVPDWVWTQYRNGLADGVLARMFSQLAKPYSSPALAKLHYGQYTATRSQARYEAMHQNNYGGQSWRFPNFSTARRLYR